MIGPQDEEVFARWHREKAERIARDAYHARGGPNQIVSRGEPSRRWAAVRAAWRDCELCGLIKGLVCGFIAVLLFAVACTDAMSAERLQPLKTSAAERPQVLTEDRETQCLALNIYHEARGEPEAGRFAVAQVTLQRVRAKGRSVCRTVYAAGQFSWTADDPKRAHGPAWRDALRIAKAVMLQEAAGLPPFVHATHYHAKGVRPYWARHMVLVATIGSHHFYRSA